MQVEVGTPRVINFRYSSLIVIEHPVAVNCLGCGECQFPIVGAIEGVKIALAPVPESEKPNLIVVPQGVITQ